MKTFDIDQRIEEIQMALANLFDSPKTSTVSKLDEGNEVVVHVSWVVESSGDSSLDERCAATIHATREQIDRYASLDTAQRRVIQQRIEQIVRARFDASRNAAPQKGACEIEIALDDETFASAPDADSFPSIE